MEPEDVTLHFKNQARTRTPTLTPGSIERRRAAPDPAKDTSSKEQGYADPKRDPTDKKDLKAETTSKKSSSKTALQKTCWSHSH